MAIKLNGVDKGSILSSMATDSHSTYVLADNPNLYEPQRSNNFEFVVTNMNNILRAGVNGSEANARIANAQEILRVSVTGAPIPHFSQEAIQISRGNNTMKVAGKPTFGSGTLTVNDYIGADTKAILMAWQNLSYNVQTEKVGLMSDYKKDAYLFEYTPDYQVVRSWRLHGCWISSLSESDYNMESSEKKTITATIEYDRAEIDTSETI